MNANALICVYERRSFKTLYSLVHTIYQCSDIERQGEDFILLSLFSISSSNSPNYTELINSIATQIINTLLRLLHYFLPISALVAKLK